MQDMSITRYQSLQAPPPWVQQPTWPGFTAPSPVPPVPFSNMYTEYMYQQRTHPAQQHYAQPPFMQGPNLSYLQEYAPPQAQELNSGPTYMRYLVQKETWTKTVEVSNEYVMNSVPPYCLMPMPIPLQRSNTENTAVNRGMQLFYQEERELEHENEARGRGGRRHAQSSRQGHCYAYASRTIESRKSSYNNAKPTQTVNPEIDDVTYTRSGSIRRSNRVSHEERKVTTSSKEYRPAPLSQTQIEPTVGHITRRSTNILNNRHEEPNSTKTSRSQFNPNDENSRLGKKRKSYVCQLCCYAFPGSEALRNHECKAKEKREKYCKTNRKIKTRKENLHMDYDSLSSLSDDDMHAMKEMRKKTARKCTFADIADSSGDETVQEVINQTENEDSLDDGRDASGEESEGDYRNARPKTSTRTNASDKTALRYSQPGKSQERPDNKCNVPERKSGGNTRYPVRRGTATQTGTVPVLASNITGPENNWPTGKRPQQANTSQNTASKRRNVQQPPKLNDTTSKRSSRKKK